MGFDINEFFAVEGEGTVGLIKDNGAKLNYELGAFAVAKLPISEEMQFFVRGGYHYSEVGLDGAGRADFDGFAVGGGLQFNMSEQSGIRGGYTYYDADQGNASGFSIAYVRNF